MKPDRNLEETGEKPEREIPRFAVTRSLEQYNARQTQLKALAIGRRVTNLNRIEKRLIETLTALVRLVKKESRREKALRLENERIEQRRRDKKLGLHFF